MSWFFAASVFITLPWTQLNVAVRWQRRGVRMYDVFVTVTPEGQFAHKWLQHWTCVATPTRLCSEFQTSLIICTRKVGYVLFSYLLFMHSPSPTTTTSRQHCHPLSARPEDLLLIKPANQTETDRTAGDGAERESVLHFPESILQQVFLYADKVSHIFILEAAVKNSNSRLKQCLCEYVCALSSLCMHECIEGGRTTIIRGCRFGALSKVTVLFFFSLSSKKGGEVE